jgi:hypothetical protein
VGFYDPFFRDRCKENLNEPPTAVGGIRCRKDLKSTTHSVGGTATSPAKNRRAALQWPLALVMRHAFQHGGVRDFVFCVGCIERQFLDPEVYYPAPHLL